MLLRLFLLLLLLFFRIPDRTGLTKIFIGNIKEGTTDEEMKSLFETYGEVAEADVCGGFGFIVSM